jgi:hypothetical protein
MIDFGSLYYDIVIEYANIFYSCCEESSCPEFGNLCQRHFFYVGINLILQTHGINTREGFFATFWTTQDENQSNG